MKNLVIFPIFMLFSSIGFAAGSCPADKSARCDDMYSCGAMYTCQLVELNNLNAFIAQSIIDVSTDHLEACRNARNLLEDVIFAHSTTIECVDTPVGKKVGG